MEENQAPQEQHLFDDFHNRVTRASSGKRIANYLIDVIGFSLFLFVVIYVMLSSGMDLPSFIYSENGEDFNLLGQLFFLLIYGMYMGLMEAILKGRSIGKLITGTVAVYEDGTRINGQTALIRGLIRAVPFNAFSGLGDPAYPWHDKWSKTFVVNFKEIKK